MDTEEEDEKRRRAEGVGWFVLYTIAAVIGATGFWALLVLVREIVRTWHSV